MKTLKLIAVTTAIALASALTACGGATQTANSAVPSTTNDGPTVSYHGWKIPQKYVRYLNSRALQATDTTKTCSRGSTKITVWNLGAAEENLYNLTHPSTCVVNVSVPYQDYYQKLLAAFAAHGAGAPDVTTNQQYDQPNLVLTGGLLDLSRYGAAAYKADYEPWAWNLMHFKGGIYGMAQDSGPLGLLYNAKLFTRYGLKVPATWTEFAQEAVALHHAHPSVYLANMGGWDTSTLQALVYWQTGAYPVKWAGGTSLDENYAQPGALAAARYWQKLYDTGALGNISWNGSFKAQAQGNVLAVLAPAWYPDVFTTTGGTMGDWRIAPLPQWRTSDHVYPNDGGSMAVVSKYSAHPALAAAFAIWLETNPASWYLWVRQPTYLFPTNVKTLHTPAYLSLSIPLTGKQAIWSTYADMATHVRAGWQWNPTEPYIDSLLADGLAHVLAHQATLSAVLGSVQRSAVSNAKNQGFAVTVTGKAP